MSERACLELAALLWLIHLLCQSGSFRQAAALAHQFARRADPAARADGRPRRARLCELHESFPVFAALDLAFIATHHPAGIWPALCDRDLHRVPAALSRWRFLLPQHRLGTVDFGACRDAGPARPVIRRLGLQDPSGVPILHPSYTLRDCRCLRQKPPRQLFPPKGR